MSVVRLGLIACTASLLWSALPEPAQAQAHDRRPVVAQVYVNGPAVVVTGDVRASPAAADRFWGPAAHADRSGPPPRSLSRAAGHAPPEIAWESRIEPPVYAHQGAPPGRRHRPVALIPTAAASSAQTLGELERALDPVVDPILDGAVQGAGAVAGVAIGVALYPTIKVLERVAGEH